MSDRPRKTSSAVYVFTEHKSTKRVILLLLNFQRWQQDQDEDQEGKAPSNVTASDI